jgi:hypothetical protein
MRGVCDNHGAGKNVRTKIYRIWCCRSLGGTLNLSIPTTRTSFKTNSQKVTFQNFHYFNGMQNGRTSSRIRAGLMLPVPLEAARP